MTVILDGAMMCGRTAAHDYLAKQLQLPDHYGKNLDALFDLLTERSRPLHIILINEAQLDGYGLRIMHTLADCANNNPAIHFEKKDC